MSYFTSECRRGPSLRFIPLALIAPSLTVAILDPAPATAQPAQIRIAVGEADLGEPREAAKVRRQIASAAHALCDTGGLADTWRGGARRCRAAVIADAERQIEERAAASLAARTAGVLAQGLGR